MPRLPFDDPKKKTDVYIGFHTTEADKRALEAVARREDRTMSAVLRQAVRTYTAARLPAGAGPDGNQQAR